MVRFAFLLALACVASIAMGCSNPKIYPANPYRDDPKISKIAVAPFLVSENIASTPSQPFPVEAFLTTDGRPAFFSVEFGDQFALGLTEFPGVEVIKASRVRDAWLAMDNNGQKANPMATRDQAMTVGRALGADAIILGQVMEWDPFVPTLTLHWSIYYTRGNTSSTSDVRKMERSATGGAVEASIDYNKDPVFTDQLTLNAETVKTQNLLDRYAASLEDIAPYHDGADMVKKQPFPRYVRFASWVAMTDAYRAEQKRGRQ